MAGSGQVGVLRRATASVRAAASRLFPLELAGFPGTSLFARILRVRLLIAGSALLSVWLMPAPLRTRAFLFAYVAAVYLPWSLVMTRASRHTEPAGILLATLVGDVSIVVVVQFTVPAAQYVCLFGYVLLVGFYAHVAGRRLGLAVAAFSGLATLIHGFGVGPRQVDGYTTGMFLAVMPSLVMLVDAVARSQRESTLRMQRLYTSLQTVSSSLDVRTVLSTVATQAAAALHAPGGTVVVRDGTGLQTIGTSNDIAYPWVSTLAREAFAVPAERRWPSVRVILEGRPILVEDVETYDGPEDWKRLLRAREVRAVAYQPIRSADGTMACLSLWFHAPRHLRPDELDLLAAFAEQASVALDRAAAFQRQHEAVEKLRELDELKSDFLSTVSHELRTPLTAIAGFASMLDTHWPQLDEDLRRDLVRRVCVNAEELHDLISQLLDFSRVERGRLTIDLKPMALEAEVERTVERLERYLARHCVEIDVDKDLTVLADRGGLARVLENLLTNAAKFSPPGGCIRVQAVERDEDVVVSVSDEGAGIPPAERERVFERFYRLDRRDQAGTSGTGIGLAIVKQFVQAQSGQVWVEAAARRGTVFNFTLRRVLVSESRAPQHAETA